jgi:hypothetical protein
MGISGVDFDKLSSRELIADAMLAKSLIPFGYAGVERDATPAEPGIKSLNISNSSTYLGDWRLDFCVVVSVRGIKSLEKSPCPTVHVAALTESV